MSIREEAQGKQPQEAQGRSILRVDDEQPRHGRSPAKMRGVEIGSPLMVGCHPTDLPEPGDSRS